MGCGTSKSVVVSRGKRPSSSQATTNSSYNLGQSTTASSAGQSMTSDEASSDRYANPKSCKGRENSVTSETNNGTSKISSVPDFAKSSGEEPSDKDTEEIGVTSQTNNGTGKISQVPDFVKISEVGPSDKDTEEVVPAGIPDGDLLPFVEFPTPHLLREANKRYAALGRAPPTDNDHKLLPYPARTAKKDLLQLNDLEPIDEHAIKAPENLIRGNLKDLVEYLCCKSENDLQKVRGIFRWLTAQNLSDLDPEKYKDMDETTALAHLMNIKGTGDYTTLFVKMCDAAGLQCAIIRGVVKVCDHTPGEDIGEESTSSWEAVVVNDEWKLFDVHWAARHQTGGGYGEWELIDDNGQGPTRLEESDVNIFYQFDEFYFMTDPEEFVYSHLPVTSEQWQMLARPVTKREFREMAYLRPPFFNLGLELLSHKKCFIEATDGEVEIELGLPLKKRRFMYRLWVSTKNNENTETFHDLKLERFVFMQQLGQKLIVKVSFPQAAKYKLELFVRVADNTAQTRFSKACSYVIQSDSAKEEIQPLPQNARKEWGPGLDMQLIGLHPLSHREAVVEAENGTAEIRLRADKPLDILHELHSNTMTKTELKNYVVHRQERDEIILTVKVPEKGEYALNLFAKEGEQNSEFLNVCSYLVTSDQSAFDPAPFPAITNGKLGVTDAGKALGVKGLDSMSDFIVAPESGELDVALEVPERCLLNSHLYYSHEAVDMDKHKFMTQEPNKAHVKMQFPEPGYYALKVFGRSDVSDGETNLSHVYSLLIYAPTPKEDCSAFPEAFTAYNKHHCQLHETTTGVVLAHKKIPLSLSVPGASAVAAISGKSWTYLQKDTEGRWKGDVDTGEPGSKLKVSADMNDSSGAFQTLLHYDVKETDDINSTLRKQIEAKEKADRQQEEKRERERKRKEDVEKTRKALEQAIDKRDMAAIRKLLKYIEQKRYVSQMKMEVTTARQVLQSLERVELLRKTILNMDNATMAEIRRYTSPPPAVHDVMVASLMLLGDHEGRTRDWKECQKLCVAIGDQGLARRVRDFRVETLHPELAARARVLLCRFRQDDVAEKSACAAIFYAWALGMTEELRLLNPAARSAQPATVKRQKEIMKQQTINK